MTVNIRAYQDRDLDGVVTCFMRSVREIGSRFYTREQLDAWAPERVDREKWFARLATGRVFVAEREGRVAGFVRVEAQGLVDLLFVHPEEERRGVGRALLEAAESWAVQQGATCLYADVSLAARALFEAAGYSVVTGQVVERGGVPLTNYRMTKGLAAERE